MHIKENEEVMIFKNDKGFYAIGMSRKDRNGTYFKGYFPCQFRKDVSVDNRTRIVLKNAFLSFYLKEEKTMPYLMITEFDKVPTRENYAKLKGEDIEENLPF